MPQRRRRNYGDEHPVAVQIGIRVQSLRLEKGLSLRTVAERGGCSISTIAQLEHGLGMMTVSTLKAISKGIGVQPFDLLNHDPNSTDIGFLLEAMRQHPECIPTVRAKASALR